MTGDPLVLHLNGVPGAGWRDDFAATGAVVRPAAIALLTAYVAGGGSVVLPQLLADPAEVARFRDAASTLAGELDGALSALVALAGPAAG